MAAAALTSNKKQRRVVYVLVGLLLATILWYALTMWRYADAGPFAIRRNTITGVVQIRRGGEWSPSLGGDRYAERVPVEDLRHLRLKDINWGPSGLIAGRTENTSPKRDVNGRIAFRVIIRKKDGSIVRDRSLQKSVKWPADQTQSWVIRTDLDTPAPEMQTTVRLEAIE